MPVDASLLPNLKNIATRLRIDSVRATTAGRQRPSDHLLLGGGPRGGALLRRDAVRPARTRSIRWQRPLRAVEGTRGAAALRRVGRGRLHPARRRSSTCGCSPRTSKAIRRRACRSSTSRPARSARASAPASASRSTRAASGPTTAPTCLHGRRRDGRRLGLGSGASVAHLDALDTLCAITDVNALGQSRATELASTTWRRYARALAGLRLARHRHRRPRHERRSSTRSPRRARPRAGRR